MSAALRPASLTVTDVQLLAAKLSSDLSGLAFDRAVVPDRPEFPHGFLKGEWSLRFRSRQSELALLLSIRPQNVFFSWERNKGPRASERATRSGFDLAMNKVLDGLKVSAVEQRPGDRVLTLWFSAGGEPRRYGLVLLLFPALPEAILVEDEGAEDYRVLGRTRAGNDRETRFRFPEANPQRESRRTLPENLEDWPRAVREMRRLEALSLRRTRLAREIRALRKNTEKRIAQQQTAEAAAEKEPDYNHYGDLLKSVLGQEPPLEATNHRTVTDWNTDQPVKIPCDPKLTAVQQVKKFYDLAKRKQRRLSEASSRAEELSRRLKVLSERDAAVETAELPDLARMENELGLGAEEGSAEAKKAYAGFEGRVFFSKEGLPILVGKTKDENLNLTFKFARGNDLWFHVQGKPGAHVVVPLRTKKHASLETLLDAACLCVYYSGGEHWGKTAVDYTQKKHVKRIKDSSEASYTQNRTLIVTVEPERMKRLKPEG